MPEKVPDPPSEAILELEPHEPKRLPFARKDGKPKVPKTTKQEMHARYLRVLLLLRQGTPDPLIKMLLVQEYGYSSKQCKRLIGVARKKLLEEISPLNKPQLCHDAYTFYRKVRDGEVQPLTNADGTQTRAPDIKDRLTAQSSIDRLLGLSAPTKIASTDPTGTYNPDELIALRQAALANPAVSDALARLAESLGGLEPGTGAILDAPTNGTANGHKNGHPDV